MKKNNIFKIVTLLLIAGLWTACGSNGPSEEEQKSIDQLEEMEAEIDEAMEELDAEVEDMNHDVDSLLEGI